MRYSRGAVVCTSLSVGAGMLYAIKQHKWLTAGFVLALKSIRRTWSKLRLDNSKTELRLDSTESKQPLLRDSVQNVISMLKTRRPKFIAEVPQESHEQPPHIPKPVWEELGRLIRAQENLKITEVPGHQWISLRLDGCGFSKQTQKLRRKGVLDDGYSAEFGEIMKECVKVLMDTFHGRLGYTQSDEMTLLIHPASVVRGQQQCHLYGGRVQKLCSTAASTATALFNRRVSQLAEKRGIVLDESWPLSHFDCRVGSFDTEEEALALVLWRAQDCGVNGVSDAVHQSKGSAKKVKGYNTADKLKWLAEQAKLPLPAHQAYGSLLLNEYHMKEGKDPRTQEVKLALRRVISQANSGESGGSRCVLNLMSQDKLSLSTLKARDNDKH